MRRIYSTLAIGVCAMGLASQAMAVPITLYLQPSTQTINVGEVAYFDVVISGLGDPMFFASLGGYSFDLHFDPAIVRANSVVFGTDLNTVPSPVYQIYQIDDGIGIVQVFEVSFETPPFLNANQPDTFTLTTLGFTGLSLSSLLSFSNVELSDENGCCGSAPDVITGAEVNVASPTMNVPETEPTWPLLGFALLGLLGLRSRWKFAGA